LTFARPCADLPPDHAGSLQSLDASPARTLRQTHQFADLRSGTVRIVLQRTQDLPVIAVEIDGHGFLA
jgi:hypothetical protein